MPKHRWQTLVEEGLRKVKGALTRQNDDVLVVGGADGDAGDGGAGPPVPAGPVLPRWLSLNHQLTRVSDARARRGDWFGGDDNWINEDYVGGVTGEGTYLSHPKISSCIGLVCLLADRITGAHFTVSSTEQQVAELLATLRAELNQGRPPLHLYVFGPSSRWVKRTSWRGERAKGWGASEIPGAVRDFKRRLGYKGKTSVADQEGGTSAWYRSQLAREGSNLVVRIERAPDQPQGPGAYTEIESTAFQLI